MLTEIIGEPCHDFFQNEQARPRRVALLVKETTCDVSARRARACMVLALVLAKGNHEMRLAVEEAIRLDSLLELLNDPDENVRMNVCYLLRQCAPPSYSYLSRMVTTFRREASMPDPNFEVQSAVAWAVSRFNSIRMAE